ncbi:MAG: hypothetical protein G01um10148_746 [Parcubacteria group bacterium Gr01-1014_8]|nr:MAG: hypothetical protein G01um10148_746 [Parcubacteria group bacterium Gr01-1014_8]
MAPRQYNKFVVVGVWFDPSRHTSHGFGTHPCDPQHTNGVRNNSVQLSSLLRSFYWRAIPRGVGTPTLGDAHQTRMGGGPFLFQHKMQKYSFAFPSRGANTGLIPRSLFRGTFIRLQVQVRLLVAAEKVPVRVVVLPASLEVEVGRLQGREVLLQEPSLA